MSNAKRIIAVADCETDPFKWGRVPHPFVWGYYDGRSYYQFKSTEEFVKFLREQPVVCFAHNGGRFDWHYLLPYLEPYSDVMLINGRIAKVMLGMSELRDSYSILPIPLKAYKKDEIDYAVMEADVRYKPDNWELISKYLRSDCVYLHELVSGFVAKFGLQITQASAAMSQWKKISEEPLPRSDKEFYEFLSPYYYGGRVECFESGIIEKDFSVYDINSAYPEAMQHLHPYRVNFSSVDAYVAGADFYRVRCVSKGAFPYRGLGNPNEFAGLRFPCDDEEREYTITGWEYNAAKETKTIHSVTVLESIIFDAHTTFKDYIQHFYDMRMECKRNGDEAGSLFAKLLMNSLYGKFAANPDNYKQNMIVPMDLIAGLAGAGWEFCGELGPWALAQQPLEESQERYYNVATGASITGFVRAKLWRAIASSKGVIYCDTDSIAVCRKGSAVTLGDRLGEWKHEGDFDKAGIAGKKLYVFRGKPDSKKHRQYKAASKGARLTHKEIWQVAAGKQVTFYNEVPTFSAVKAPHFVKRKIRYTAAKRG